ncbi:MAG: C25 family cysteine peptidase [Candidatus Cloacimonetes bacterium]|nr:C25 family cysteine peptidase [Candidatus Cloacimonadota bacterium]
MKKIYHLILVLTGIFQAMFLQATEVRSAINTQTLSNELTRITFTLPDYDFSEYTDEITQTTFQKIVIDEGLSAPLTGFPEVPIFSLSIAVPKNSTISIENVVYGQINTIENIMVYPTQDYENPARTFDFETAFYHTRSVDSCYPEELFFISDIQNIREYEYVSININPMRYYSNRKSLEVIEDMEIIVRHQTTDARPTYQTKRKISKAFEPLYENLLANYNQIRLVDPEYQTPCLLIIYGYNTNMTSLNRLVSWKEQRGFEVHTVSAVTLGSAGSIKNYVQNAYNNWDNPPDYLLLIGRAASTGTLYGVPSNAAPGGQGLTDYNYVQLTTGSQLGDMFVGRLSPNSDGQFERQVEKILAYEQTPFLGGEAWLQRALLVADTSTSGISTQILSKYVKSLILDNNPSHTFSEHYLWNPNPNLSYTQIVQGVNTFNYRGLGGMSNFQVTEANINNPNKLPFCIWVTCNTGNLSDSLIDQITRITPTSGALTGAIGAMGMANNYTHTAWNNVLSGSVYYGLYPGKMATLGQANLFARHFVVQNYANIQFITTANNFASWLNLVGDPTVNVYKSKPEEIFVQIPASLPTGTQGIRFQLTDILGLPIRDAWITICQKNTSHQITYITKAITDNSGVGYVNLDPALIGTAEIVITKSGYVTKKQNIALNIGTTVSVQDYQINDSLGNNNGEVNPGETIMLTINVKNFNTSLENNLSATITSENNLITIINDTATLGPLPAGGVQNYYDAFTFEVSPLFGDKTLIPFTITITNGSDEWQSYLTIPVKGMNLNVMSMTPSQIPINTTASLYFTFINNGTYAGYDLELRFISMSPNLVVMDSTAFLGNVLPGQQVNHSADPFSVFVLPIVFPGIILDADLLIYNNQGYEERIQLKIPVGDRLPTDPTGPCDYGYIIYGSNDITYPDAPIYHWEGIKTRGVNTGIVDNSALVEEGGVNMPLPFIANYYGVEYNQIFICSNGWFVFGDTTQRDFRNLPLPGPIAPKAMVAPYWTDLVVGGSYGGAIYTYEDTVNHSFIIQWDCLKWVTGYHGSLGYAGFYVSTDSVTFQAIIYDPSFYPTPKGDSKIKLQYKRWNPGIPGDSNQPSNYVTVGFQDHSELRGLTYVYNNIYTPGSAPLSSGMALLITQPEFLNVGPYVTVNQIALHDENGNGIIEENERVDIGISLINTGTTLASDVRVTLTFDTPLVTVEQGYGIYGDLDVLESKTNTEYFVIRTATIIPADIVAIGNLRITSNFTDPEPQEWTRQIFLNVKKRSFEYMSYMINDYDGNNNGVVEAGEDIKLIINIKNPTDLDIKNVTGVLQTNHTSIVIPAHESQIKMMLPNTSYQFVFDVSIGEDILGYDIVPLLLTMSADDIAITSYEINLGVNRSNIVLENYCSTLLPTGWQIVNYSNQWSVQQTNNAGGEAPELRFVGVNQNGSTQLVSPQLDTRNIGAVLLSFKHAATITTANRVNLRVETSQPGSPWSTVWFQSFIQNYSGVSENVIITSNLSSESFRFRFVIEGVLADIITFNLDDIILAAVFGNSAILKGEVSFLTTFLDKDKSMITVTADNFSTNVLENGSYTLYLFPTIYEKVHVKDPYLYSNAYLNQVFPAGQIISDKDFRIRYMVPAYNIRSKVDDNHDLVLTWDHIFDYTDRAMVFEHFKVYRQTNCMEFSHIATISEPDSYDEEYERHIYKYHETALDINNRYRYYVQAFFDGKASEISQIKYIDPNIVYEEDDNPWVDEKDGEIEYIKLTVHGNYPNPFNPSTSIKFTIPEKSKVSIKIYNIKGQLVKNLKNEIMDTGTHIVQWNGDNDQGKLVGSGIYFIKVADEKHSIVRKSVLLK